MDLESVVLQLDPRSVLAATTEANKAVESWEKGTVGAGERMQRALEHQSDMLLKVHDKSREATERLTRSIIAQNEAYGRSPIEQEIMKRDRLIKKLGDEKSMVDAVRASYAAKIKVMEAEAAGGAGGSGFNARYAFFGAKDLMEGRTKFATAELANELMRMRGAALGIGLVVTAIAAIGFAAYEVTKKVQELRDAEEKLRGEFSRLADSNRLENTELELSNTKLENLLAKLQHKPGNAAKEALEEAAVAAGHLADKLDTAIGKFYELLKKNEVSGIMQLFAPSDKDLAQLVGGATGLGGMRASVYSALEKGEDPTKTLASYRMTVAAQLKQAEYSQAHPMTAAQRATAGYRAMGPGGIAAAILPNEDETGRIEKLHSLMQQIDDVTRSYALETEHGKLAGAVGRAQNAAAASKPQDEALKEFRRQAQEFERKGDEAELSAIGKIYYQRDLLLKQAEKLKGVEADIAGIRKAADKQASEEFAKSYAAFDKIAGGETSEKRQRAMASAIRSSLSGYDKDQETQRTIDRIEMQSEVGVLNRRASGARAAVGASGLTGMDAIRATYQIRIDLAQQLAGVEAARIAKEDDADKKRIDNAKMVADVQRETAEAQQEAMLKEMELQKQQFEGLKRDTEGLWSTLLTKPGKFGKQLANTVHSAVIKPVAEGMANMTASVLHPIIYGANGNGGIASIFGSMFGGKSASKPMDRLFKEPLPVMIVSGGSMPSGGGVSAETPQSMIQSVMAHPATRTILTSVMSAGMMAAPIMAGGAPSVAPNYVPAMYGSAVSGTAVGSGGGYFGGGCQYFCRHQWHWLQSTGDATCWR